MTTKFGFDPIVKWLLICSWFALFVGGVIHYPGSWLSYTIFSLAFLTMLISGFHRQVSYGYIFLVIFLWLGFWLKLTVHLLITYPFGEAIGYFNGTAAAWDKALWVAIVASVGVMTGRLLYGRIGLKFRLVPESEAKVPAWYPAIRKWLWLVVLVAIVSFALANTYYGILQIGLVPRTILPWPLNAAIAWMVSIGSAMGIATLLWWDMSMQKDLSLSLYAILVEAFLATTSLLSRGVYIFHVIPQALAIYINRYKLIGFVKGKMILMLIIFICLFVISTFGVTVLRNHYYSDFPLDFGSGSGSGNNQLVSVYHEVSRLVVDRWIGVEGVMAVSAYPDKGGKMFLNALMETPEIGKVDRYQKISNSQYQSINLAKFQFASLPGAAGFLYYSGSLWIVMLGMVVLTLFVLLTEALTVFLTANPILGSLYGLTAANTVAQLGVTPRQMGPYFFMIFCGVLMIWLVQSSLFSTLLQKVGLLRLQQSEA